MSAQANVQLLRLTSYILKELDNDLPVTIMSLIRTLNSEAYSLFRSSLLLMADCRFQAIKETFIHEQRNQEPREAEQAVVMKVSTSLSSSKGKSKYKYDFCGKQNHILSYCF